MRAREEKWIVTFPTAAAAMAMERRAKELRIPGRIIPNPHHHHGGLRSRVDGPCGGPGRGGANAERKRPCVQ